MAFVKRHLTFKFQLGTGSFGAGGFDTFEISGLRASVNITKSGSVMSQADMRIFGMPLDVMDKLTILGNQLVDGRNNVVTVLAGDDNGGAAVVFEGIIREGWVDTRNAPQVAFIVSAFSGLLAALKPVPPVSYKGTVNVALVMSGIATQMGVLFENSGVNVQISNPYLHGTLREQMIQIGRAAPCNYTIDDGTLAIWPVGGARKGLVPVISPETGMQGYPMRTEAGVRVVTLFTPSITYGTTIEIRSDFGKANGRWNIYGLVHDLESETPGGKWSTALECNVFGSEAPLIGQ